MIAFYIKNNRKKRRRRKGKSSNVIVWCSIKKMFEIKTLFILSLYYEELIKI